MLLFLLLIILIGCNNAKDSIFTFSDSGIDCDNSCYINDIENLSKTIICIDSSIFNTNEIYLNGYISSDIGFDPNTSALSFECEENPPRILTITMTDGITYNIGYGSINYFGIDTTPSFVFEENQLVDIVISYFKNNEFTQKV